MFAEQTKQGAGGFSPREAGCGLRLADRVTAGRNAGRYRSFQTEPSTIPWLYSYRRERETLPPTGRQKDQTQHPPDGKYCPLSAAGMGSKLIRRHQRLSEQQLVRVVEYHVQQRRSQRTSLRCRCRPWNLGQSGGQEPPSGQPSWLNSSKMFCSSEYSMSRLGNTSLNIVITVSTERA